MTAPATYHPPTTVVRFPNLHAAPTPACCDCDHAPDPQIARAHPIAPCRADKQVQLGSIYSLARMTFLPWEGAVFGLNCA